MYLTKQEKDLFGGLVKIPVPQYVVFYNGDTNKPERYKMRLSEAFDFSEKNEELRIENAADYEWTAEVININTEKIRTNIEDNVEISINGLHKKCDALYDYIKYVNRVKTNQKNRMEIKTAVDEAVEWAINKNLLEGFFAEQKAEVTAMSLTEFDQELYDKNRRREGYDEGKQDGLIEGAREKTIETAKNFYKNGASKDLIAKSLNMSLEELEAILENSEE